MIRYSEAISLIRDEAAKQFVGTEDVSLETSAGRVSAEDVLSGESVPPFDNSAMDGFAVAASSTIGASENTPVRVRVLGTIAAGDPPEKAAPILAGRRNERAWEIMTGAPMPGGDYDAVVKIEDVGVVRDGKGESREVILKRPMKPGENVRFSGADFRPGQAIVKAGRLVQPHHVLALATLGVSRIQVRRRVRVAVVSTGRELVPWAETRLAPGMIRNSTAPYLMSVLPRMGAEARFHGTVADDPGQFEGVLARILKEGPDIILTTGAVSMGKFDFILDSVEKMGGTTVFHKAAIRPGKPVLFARFGRTGPVLFGSPGNPVSTAVCLRFFVEPCIRTLLSMEPEKPARAKLMRGARKPEGLRCFYKAKTWAGPEGFQVELLDGQESFKVAPMLDTDSWAVLDEKGGAVEKGDPVDVYPILSGLGG